jgi:hypothetical protein
MVLAFAELTCDELAFPWVLACGVASLLRYQFLLNCFAVGFGAVEWSTSQ